MIGILALITIVAIAVWGWCAELDIGWKAPVGFLAFLFFLGLLFSHHAGPSCSPICP